MALNPEVTIELGKDDEIVYYTITATDVAKKEMTDNLLRQYGSLEEGESAKEDDFIIVDFVQGETSVEGAYVALRNVAEVKTFVSAQMNQDTYDKIFGEGAVSDEKGFEEKVEERLRAEYAQEADFRFMTDAKKYLVEKAGVNVAEKFLKRWVFVANEGKFTMEEIEKEWDLFIADYKWQMVRSALMQKYNVKIEEADMLASAKGFAAYQFAMYGMNNVPDEQLEAFAKNILAQEEQGRRILDQVENEKTLAAVREVVTLKKKKISVEKFRELK